MFLATYIWTFALIFAVIGRKASSQTFRIPNAGDSCNLVNLNFGRADEMTEQSRGPQGPSGKRGSPGPSGIKGEKGAKGEVGPVGIAPEVNLQVITDAIMKLLRATSCDELMKVHGITENGYYLLRSNITNNPVYVYCGFAVHEGIETCDQLRMNLGNEMKAGYFQLASRNFAYCSKDEPKDCKGLNRIDAMVQNDSGGVFDIYPLSKNQNVRVYCDLTTDGGGWIVFQRRMDGSVDFYRNWNDYVNGFGRPDGEFWLGLENIHQITSTGAYELRIDISDWDGNSVFAKYGTFSVGTQGSSYRLTVRGYTGTAADSLKYHDNMRFTTKDADHDTSGGNCATSNHGAWWYGSCRYSNLNGKYYPGPGTHYDGVVWQFWKNGNTHLKFVEMKMRKTA